MIKAESKDRKVDTVMLGVPEDIVNEYVAVTIAFFKSLRTNMSEEDAKCSVIGLVTDTVIKNQRENLDKVKVGFVVSPGKEKK